MRQRNFFILFIFISLFSLSATRKKSEREIFFNSVYTDTVRSYYSSTSELKSSHIPDSVFTMYNLEHLGISGMDCDYGDFEHCWEIKEIPPAIKNLKKLKSLTLNVNSITVIPIELTELKNLAEINFDDNAGFQNIDNLTKMTWLENLSLNGCGLSNMPVEIGKLKSLKSLGLAGNNFDKEEIARIKKALPGCRIYF